MKAIKQAQSHPQTERWYGKAFCPQRGLPLSSPSSGHTCACGEAEVHAGTHTQEFIPLAEVSF